MGKLYGVVDVMERMGWPSRQASSILYRRCYLRVQNALVYGHGGPTVRRMRRGWALDEKAVATLCEYLRKRWSQEKAAASLG